jgi:hypothetical protein
MQESSIFVSNLEEISAFMCKNLVPGFQFIKNTLWLRNGSVWSRMNWAVGLIFSMYLLVVDHCGSIATEH